MPNLFDRVGMFVELMETSNNWIAYLLITLFGSKLALS